MKSNAVRARVCGLFPEKALGNHSQQVVLSLKSVRSFRENSVAIATNTAERSNAWKIEVFFGENKITN